MSLKDSVQKRIEQREPNHLSQALKGKKYDRALTKEEEQLTKATPYEVSKSGQKVFLYEKTNIGQNNVKRVGLGRRRKTRRNRKSSTRARRNR